MRVILLFCLLTLTCLAGDPVPKSHDVGRFRLLRAPVTASTDRTKVEFNAVFRIDSVTGKTWLYLNKAGSNDVINAWAPIGEVPELAAPGSFAALEPQLDAFLQWADDHKGGNAQFSAEQISTRRAQIEQAKKLLFPH